MYFLLLIYTCTSVFDLLKTFTFLFVKVNTTAYFQKFREEINCLDMFHYTDVKTGPKKSVHYAI